MLKFAKYQAQVVALIFSFWHLLFAEADSKYKLVGGKSCDESPRTSEEL